MKNKLSTYQITWVFINRNAIFNFFIFTVLNTPFFVYCNNNNQYGFEFNIGNLVAFESSQKMSFYSIPIYLNDVQFGFYYKSNKHLVSLRINEQRGKKEIDDIVYDSKKSIFSLNYGRLIFEKCNFYIEGGLLFNLFSESSIYSTHELSSQFYPNNLDNSFFILSNNIDRYVYGRIGISKLIENQLFYSKLSIFFDFPVLKLNNGFLPSNKYGLLFSIGAVVPLIY